MTDEEQLMINLLKLHFQIGRGQAQTAGWVEHVVFAHIASALWRLIVAYRFELGFVAPPRTPLGDVVLHAGLGISAWDMEQFETEFVSPD